MSPPHSQRDTAAEQTEAKLWPRPKSVTVPTAAAGDWPSALHSFSVSRLPQLHSPFSSRAATSNPAPPPSTGNPNLTTTTCRGSHHYPLVAFEQERV